MKLHEKKEDAVSPVIGVMLMIVVTIVIAAVITAFATGTAGDATATTPMAMVEADNLQMGGSLLYSFDLVHKGGDEMKLENLLVTLEPIGGDGTGIILERTATPFELNPDAVGYENMYNQIVQDYNDGIFEDEAYVPHGTFTLETTEGSSALSVRGKKGDDVVVSTGDRIKVSIKLVGDGVAVCYNGQPIPNVNAAIYKYIVPDEGRHSEVYSDTLLKWTLSDIRTNGVIAKGEFVVPKA